MASDYRFKEKITMTIKDIEKEFDNTYDLDNYGGSHIMNRKVKSFIRTAIQQAFEATKGEKRILGLDMTKSVIERVYDCDVTAFNQALAEQQKRQEEFMKGKE